MTRPRSRLATLIVVATLGLVQSGCVTVLPREKPVQLYRFGPGAPSVKEPAVSRTPVALVGPTLPAAARGDGILTVTGDQTAYIAGARWVSPAAVLLQEAAPGGLEAQAAHVRVLRPGEPGAALRLQILIRRFETVYAGGAPTVRIEGVAQLADVGGRLIAVQPLAADVPAAANRVGPIVAAYDQAVAEVLAEAGRMVEGAVTRTP